MYPPSMPTMLSTVSVLFALSLARLAHSAPEGFPATGNGLWYTTPGTIWSRHNLPVGNGFLAATTPGGLGFESTQLNIESLWSGGPFSDASYNGGNKQPSQKNELTQAMSGIRQSIFESPNGTIEDINSLMSDTGAYGSYAGAGYLISSLIGPASAQTTSGYGRFLDLDKGIAQTSWKQGQQSFTRQTFCSQPDQICAQNTSTGGQGAQTLSQSYAYLPVVGMPPVDVTCLDNATLSISGNVSDPGMAFELLVRVFSDGGKVACNISPVFNESASRNATIVVSGAKSSSAIWVGGTNYDMDAGDAAHDFSFQGENPYQALLVTLNAASNKSYTDLLAAHVTDYTEALHGDFSLDLGAVPNLDTPTDQLKAQYEVDTGNPYLEWVLFNYGRHMLASSSRGALPANLQGKWADAIANAWNSDYHANINLQMSYWSAESTNLNVTQPLWNFIEKTWVPRGTYTADVLYDISNGWVMHTTMNPFGSTGMSSGDGAASWADYPEGNAWMMVHVWDHFDFTNDVAWWKAQGYPLLKGVASFHLQKLIQDDRFQDGSLIVSPCNSPEQSPITLGCAHAQQVIWQLFNAVEKGAAAAGEEDQTFLNEVKEKKAQMDKGIHIGSWGQLQEWKVDMDQKNDTHRHLSHLIGLYPGYAVSNFDPSIQIQNGTENYTKDDVLAAAQTSLIHRGNGTGPDADSGWEKVWRAACWAQLANASTFYHELTYAVQRNFAENLFSIYDPGDVDPIFQIDANLGFPGAVMNALLQSPDVASISTPLTIKLLPALPDKWTEGSLRGARVRGGVRVNLFWSKGRPTSVTLSVDDSVAQRSVRVEYEGREVASFTTSGGEVHTITNFT